MILVSLSPDAIYSGWDRLRAGILECANKTGALYKPEDVYMRLRAGTAWAYAIKNHGDDLGFTILTQEFDCDGLALFIWILWAEPLSLRGDESAVYGELERIAREIKAKRIRMHSPRPGWAREPFFNQVAIVYEHEVT